MYLTPNQQTPEGGIAQGYEICDANNQVKLDPDFKTPERFLLKAPAYLRK
ncbi:MAG: hypothetical protein ACI955_002900 [Zhongshania sp.]|jgi:hypothetical protein